MSLAKRLFVAFLLIVLVGVICWAVLPRYGLDVPPIVVFLGYGVIVAACLLAAAPGKDDEDDQGSGSGQPPGIAGRIGTGSDDAGRP